jgi:hypothetical protein
MAAVFVSGFDSLDGCLRENPQAANVGLSHSLFHMHNNSLRIITLQNEIG